MGNQSSSGCRLPLSNDLEQSIFLPPTKKQRTEAHVGEGQVKEDGRGFVPRNHSVKLYLNCDEDSLTAYQCLARKQIEFFEVQESDLSEVHAKAGGRRYIEPGQIGIRCIHCAHLRLCEKAKGSTYYPKKLDRIYQAAQNMANSHISKFCPITPQNIRNELLKLGNQKSEVGKDYWSKAAKVLGLEEYEAGLRFYRTEP